ncbi:PP2C family protein-serine/threonine phosphatase [Amycolatopsis dongchuanensis]|uniref:Stage II sporulation protein E (SpoIIE) n=2 Tax=Amycolatopsis TaxID=1813 RepID=A0A1I3QY81_9PSEU|nr:Stage II sporulation protein E (SpoIIE) [Amycolatopsis sacchari]
MVDGGGLALAANERARLLFPPGPLPEWLGAAHAAGAATAAGLVGQRSFEGHAAPHGNGCVTWWLVEDTELRQAREALRIERTRAEFLSEASTALLGSLNLERCMEVAARLAAEHLADAALVISPAQRSRHPVTRCARGERPVHAQLEFEPDELPGLGEALQGFPPVPSRWIDPAAAPDWLVPPDFGELGAIVVTPLPGHGVPAGALVLLRRAEQPVFSEDEEIFARLFASRSGAAMSAARVFAQQASITETLMRDLLPPPLEHVAGVEFAGGYRPSQDSEHVGGDFYDVHPGSDGESLAVLGDVCGKGLEAALLTGKIRNTLHALLPMAGDHHRVLSLLNGALLSSHSTRFVTLVLASASRDGAGVRLRLTAAGHLPPLVVRANGQVEEAETAGTLVGVLPEITTTTAELTLGPGETCLLYTDGITEARGGPLGGELFGEERLRRALTECGGMPAEAVVERVQMLATQWIGRNSHDDMAVLAITAPRGQHLTAVGGHGRGRYTA